MPELILASQSPRRQALLAALGVKFTVQPADVDESPLPGESPDGMVCRLCRVKALAVAVRQPGAIVLAADTVVALGGRLFGKPADAAEATTMLRDLRGRSHTVFTALALVQDGVARTRLNASQVIMRDYSDAEITAYVASGDPLDKAGAYAIQHPAFSPAADWEGCYAGIMGLPLAMARELLMEAGAPAAKDVAAVCHALGGGKCCTTSVTSAASATSAASTWSNHA